MLVKPHYFYPFNVLDPPSVKHWCVIFQAWIKPDLILMFGWVGQDQAAFRSASCGNNDLSNFAKPFLQRAEWMGEIWIKATAGIEIWMGETWVMAQYCGQAWNSSRDVGTYLQNAPFHIFTHNTRFGHHPRPLCVCLRCLFFFGILQCFRLGLSLGSSVCFGASRHPSAVVGGWLSPGRDETGRMVVLFTSYLSGLLFEASASFSRPQWRWSWTCHFWKRLEYNYAKHTWRKKIPNQSTSRCVVWFWFKTWQIFFFVFWVKILDYCITLHSLESHETVEHLAPKLMMEMISHFI